MTVTINGSRNVERLAISNIMALVIPKDSFTLVLVPILE